MSIAADDTPFPAQPPGWPIAQDPPPERRRRAHHNAIARFAVVVVMNLAILILSLPSAQAWLHISSPWPDCDTAGISRQEGREGTCADRRGLFGLGGARVSVVVDRAHTLRMPGYRAELITSSVQAAKVTTGGDDDYPGGSGWRASFTVRLTNDSDKPLWLDAQARDVALIVPTAQGSSTDIIFSQNPRLPGSRGGLLGERGPIAPGASVAGPVDFVLPIWTRTFLREPGANLQFFVPGHRDHDLNGLIRLWQ